MNKVVYVGVIDNMASVFMVYWTLSRIIWWRSVFTGWIQFALAPKKLQQTV